MGIIKTIRQTFGRSQVEPVTGLLIKQIDLAIEAVELADQACGAHQDPRDLAAPAKTLRAEARSVGQEVFTEMSEALTVPLEREDLSRASQALTTITSDARDIVREMVVWQVTPGSWSEGVLSYPLSALRELRGALDQKTYAQIGDQCRQAYNLAAKTRKSYREGLTDLFSQELTMDTLKKREILRRVDLVGRHLADLSATLVDALAKRYL